MDHPLLFLNILFLHWSGFSPMKTNIFSLIRMIWTAFCYALVMTWLFMEFLLNYEGFSTVTRAIELLPVFLLCSGKMYFLLARKTNARSMVIKTRITLEKYYTKKIIDIGLANTNLVYKMFKLYVVSILLTFVQFQLTAYLNRTPFILTYKEQTMSDIYWRVVFFMDINFFITASLFYVGYNWLFLYFVTYIVSEMKMLKIAVTETIAKVDSTDFRRLVKHHVHILGLVKDISDNYSSIMLGEFVLNALSVCFSLFCWTMDGLPPDMEHTTRYGNSAFNFGLSLFLFCYAGDKLTEQCEEMTYVIFYKIMDKPLTKDTKFSSFMIMGRSQMRTAISVGGFWDLNMESYYMVMRKCMSFLTFMQALRDGGKKHNGNRSRTSLAF